MVKIYTKKYTKNIKKKNKSRNNKRSRRRQKGGANCPKEGFRQHRGECWNDSMMMVLCYSNGIGDRNQAFFHDVTQIQARYKKQNPYLNSDFIIQDCIKKYIALPRHKEEYKHLLPLNLDLDNPNDYKTFEENAIAYIQNMYTRYQNKKEHPLDSPPPIAPDVKNPKTHQKSLKKIKSYNSSISCVKANYDVYNINKKKAQPYSFDKHGGLFLNQIITICMINYFLINLIISAQTKSNEKFEIKVEEAKDRKMIDLNYVELLPYIYTVNIIRKIKLDKNILQAIEIRGAVNKQQDAQNDILLFIENYNKAKMLLEKYTSLFIDIYYTPNSPQLNTENEEIGHVVSFFKCKDEFNYYNDNLQILEPGAQYRDSLIKKLKYEIDSYNQYETAIKTTKTYLKENTKTPREKKNKLKQFLIDNNKINAIYNTKDDDHIVTRFGGVELKEFNYFPTYYHLVEPFCSEYNYKIIIQNILRNMYGFFNVEMFKTPLNEENKIKWGDLCLNLYLYHEKINVKFIIDPYVPMFTAILHHEDISEYFKSKKRIYPALKDLFDEDDDVVPLSPVNLDIDPAELEDDDDEVAYLPPSPTYAPIDQKSRSKSKSRSRSRSRSKSRSRSRSKSRSNSKNSS